MLSQREIANQLGNEALAGRAHGGRRALPEPGCPRGPWPPPLSRSRWLTSARLLPVDRSKNLPEIGSSGGSTAPVNRMDKPFGGNFQHISRSFLDLRQIATGVI